MTYYEQLEASALLMENYRQYAIAIGCTTYPPGPMHDSIECNAAQAELLGKWWHLHTQRPVPPYVEEPKP